MPHHGSRENITAEILDAIQLKVAFISHNNRRFGRAKDSLSNTEVLELLDNKAVDVMLTNDVRKPNVRCMSKSNHLGDQFMEVLRGALLHLEYFASYFNQFDFYY